MLDLLPEDEAVPELAAVDDDESLDGEEEGFDSFADDFSEDFSEDFSDDFSEDLPDDSEAPLFLPASGFARESLR